MPKLMERCYYYAVFAMCWSALRISKDEQVVSGTAAIQGRRYSVDSSEFFCL